MNRASSILTCHHNLNMCRAKQYQNYKMPVAVQSLVPLHSPAPFLPPPPGQAALAAKHLQNQPRSLGQDQMPLGPLLEILPFPQESTRAATAHPVLCLWPPGMF